MKLELFIPATQGVRVAYEISSKLLYIKIRRQQL